MGETLLSKIEDQFAHNSSLSKAAQVLLKKNLGPGNLPAIEAPE